MRPPARNCSCKHCKLVRERKRVVKLWANWRGDAGMRRVKKPAVTRSYLIKRLILLFAGRGRPGSIGTHRRRTLEMACPQAVLRICALASSPCLVVIAIVFCPTLTTFAQ